MTNENLVQTIKDDILALISSGVIVRDVATFEDLHSYVDANTLGAQKQVFGDLCKDGGEANVQAACDVIGEVQAQVDNWLRNRRI